MVSGMALGSHHRNHCPRCLYSRHVDLLPGDRRSACRGVMEPLAVFVRPDGELMLVHSCLRCSRLSRNRVAGDDDPKELYRLARRPIESGSLCREALEDERSRG